MAVNALLAKQNEAGPPIWIVGVEAPAQIAQNMGAYYDSKKKLLALRKPLLFEQDDAYRALHECVHLSFDVQWIRSFAWYEEEAIAYVAGHIYVHNTGQMFGYGDPRAPETDFEELCEAVSDRARIEGVLSDQDLGDIGSKLKTLPTYKSKLRRGDRSYDRDGVPGL